MTDVETWEIVKERDALRAEIARLSETIRCLEETPPDCAQHDEDLKRLSEIVERERANNERLRAALDKAQVDLQVAAGNLDRAGYAMFAENARIKANEARRALEGNT